jgi:hypothetical protein
MRNSETCKVSGEQWHGKRARPLADEVGGSCSTGIECAKVQLL